MMHIFGDECMNIPEGWSIQENHLMREFSFEDFASAKAFTIGAYLLAATPSMDYDLRIYEKTQQEDYNS